MIDELVNCCKERLALGQTDIKQLSDHIASLNETERKSVYYHSECRKPIVNKTMIEHLRAKHVWSDSPAGSGRPSSAADSARPKRIKTTPKAKMCIFSSCSFCSNGTSEPLYHVFFR